jgi:peptidoglycan lytic transglycosylase
MRLLTLIAALTLAVAATAAWVVKDEPDWYLRARYPLEYEQIIVSHARSRHLDPALLAAMVYVESRFDPNAESEAGALGLMQLLPETAEGIALRTGGDRFLVSDLRDPDINVRYGSWYVRHLVDRYGRLELALAAYHAGQGNVDEWQSSGEGIVFPETRTYVSEVQRVRQIYADAYFDRR